MSKPCTQCGSPFDLTSEDHAFLKKLAPEIGGKTFELPDPTLCPDCRLQRRLAWRMERTLYFRTCDATGKKIMSIVSPESPYKAYHHEAWYGDKWNALDFGRAYDPSRPFFAQFTALMREVPLLSLSVVGLQNCDYVNQVGFSKNCYLIVEADYNQDCLYGYRIFYNRSCMDIAEVTGSEQCYECVDCTKGYNLKYAQLCRQCVDSAFLFDCRGCTSCFGCAGLRQKQHCLFNRQLTKEQYQTQLAAFDFCNPTHVQAAQAQLETLKLKHPRKAFIGDQNESVSGNYIDESKDCSASFGLRACRDCRHCQYIRDAKDCMDYFVWGDKAEKIYDCQTCGINVQNLRFCCDCWDGSRDLTYCFQCVLGTHDCFGCVGVQKGKYCILNKQYTQEEYEALVPKIIEDMKRNGEWGGFFPASISPYAYNETAAQESFPLSESDAAARGLGWRKNLPFTTGKETLTWDKVPRGIEQVPDTILNEVLACEATKKNYRIAKKELEFLRQWKLPIPRFHPDERHRRRAALRNPRKLWDRKCAKCGTAIQTSYAPDRPEIVYCEECYLGIVY